MASDVVIRAEGLGKKYIIGHQAERERYTTLRDSVSRSLRGWGRSARDMLAGKALVAGDETEEFWALKDIDFEIRRGEVVGIIGHNGAGKSTLLKVLSRITEPTKGRVTIDGRVASLLEVGTGFHPELSGRENIYLNGAILGMSREEIHRKFDEIVAFAGVERFLDTPVKRYSSGMYVRLAFAVAAHLEPEILIVDEVLAVGDAEFQKKCLGKMQDVAGQGRTVLFVSHNMAAVRALCSKGILLQQGSLAFSGDVEDTLFAYSNNSKRHTALRREKKAQGASITAADILWDKDRVYLKLQIYSVEQTKCAIEAKIVDQSGNPVGLAGLGCWSSDARVPLREGDNFLEVSFSSLLLAQGLYTLTLALTDPGHTYLDVLSDDITFEISGTIRAGENRAMSLREGHGAVRIDMTMTNRQRVSPRALTC